MYGSMEDLEEAAMVSSRNQPLLPPRDPAAAAARRQRLKRQSTATKPLASTIHAQPVMGSLFRSPNKSTRRLSQQRMSQGAQQGPEIPQAQSNTTTTNTTATTPNHHRQRRQRRRHSWLYMVLHSHSRHPHAVLYQRFISTVILLDVILFVASTEPNFTASHPSAETILYWEEGLASSLFLLEYICRLAVIPESSQYAHIHPWLARWRYAQTWPAMIDLVSAVPFFLEVPSGWNLPNLTWIRVFRLFRILKTQSFVRSMDTVYRVLYYNREILYVAANLCLVLVLITSLLMYYLRPQQHENNDNTDQFRSLTATMYLAAMMLTGQGQPDGDDLPWYTKAVVLLTGIFSVAMFAIPASMLTWGFEAEAERCAKRARQKFLEQQQEEEEQQQEGDTADGYWSWSSSSSSNGGDTTDDEYMAIIAGGDDGGDDTTNGADLVVQQLMKAFQTSDTDASGSLSMEEFVAMMTDPSMASEQTSLVGMAASVGFLAQRVQELERQSRATHAKLERLVKLLEKQQK